MHPLEKNNCSKSPLPFSRHRIKPPTGEGIFEVALKNMANGEVDFY